MNERVKVVVTGAAGQIAYSLIPRLVDGKTFGNKKVDCVYHGDIRPGNSRCTSSAVGLNNIAV